MKFLGKSISPPAVTIDTNGYKRLQTPYGESNLMLYIIVMFLASLFLYFGTKNWSGLSAPEELDLGSVPTHQPHRDRHKHGRRPNKIITSPKITEDDIITT